MVILSSCASINVKPEGGGGGEPGHMWGILLFRRIFSQNPHRRAPKFGQIRSNILSFVLQALVIFKRGILLVNG